jgi:RNA recognition motif-containing protein
VDRKRIYFNLRENPRGRYLKIAEVNGMKRSTVLIPERGFKDFMDTLQDFLAKAPKSKREFSSKTEEPRSRIDPSILQNSLAAGTACNLWVENLPWDLSEDDLYKQFQMVGTVRSAKINRTHGGMSRGTATILMSDASQAQRAIQQLNGTSIGGRPITVRMDRLNPTGHS